MGGQRPGPLCGTTSEPIDEGTSCRHLSSALSVLGTDSAPNKSQTLVRFSELWHGYHDSKPYADSRTGKIPEGFDNQCAIKMSVALIAGGVKLTSFHGAFVFINESKAAIRAEELTAWLKKEPIFGISIRNQLPAKIGNPRSKGGQESCILQTIGYPQARRHPVPTILTYGTEAA